jgi:hypothetical protein
MDAGLRYTLTAQTSYREGEPIPIGFRLENSSARALWVLKWYTPLEGLKGQILEVRCDGVTVPYEGRMVKRGQPAEEDYVHLAPGGSAAADVDLAEAYTLPPRDVYEVRFTGRIMDVAFVESEIPRPADAHEGMTIAGNTISFRILDK